MAQPLPGCGNRPSAHAAPDEESIRISGLVPVIHTNAESNTEGIWRLGAVSPGVSGDYLCCFGCLDDECEQPARAGSREANFEYPV